MQTNLVKTITGLATALIVGGLCVTACAESRRRENTYPDPGYTLLGCFRDADARFFDYSVGTILQSWRGETFLHKQQWWAEYKQAYES